ncbi:MAG: aspartate aminotransferase family protein [Dehalococcoidia bacterium]|nr:aspartate aminotransferase family protein [Dehalococcoidia bacterium]
MENWQEQEALYMLQTIKRYPITLVKGRGARVWDDQGKKYLDFIGGWAVNCLGHCHPVTINAMTRQARQLIKCANQFYSIPQIQLARLLAENTCLDRSFFLNSGAEANEAAVKLARKYGKLHLGGAYEVITALHSFHGRTLAMTAATGKPEGQESFKPMPAGFPNVEYDNIEAIKAATNDRTCAILLEPVQGEGGVNVPAPDYLRKVRDWCDEKGLLLILDEVQTGVGRTGFLFAYQEAGVEPDIMTLAKGLGGGVPIGAVLAKERAAVFEPGDHGSTFGGNPVSCAVARDTFRYVIENDISGNARRVGEYLMARLSELKSEFEFVTEVRGKGLLVAMEFDRDISRDVVYACMKKSLLLNGVKPNAIRFMPSLNITNREVDEAVGILQRVLARLPQSPS